MARDLNSAHALYGDVRLCVAVDDDNTTIKDFKTPTRVITQNTGVSVKAGTLGYVFELEDVGGGTSPRGIEFGTKPWVEAQTGEGFTILVIFDKWINGFNLAAYPQWNTTSVGMPYLAGTGTNKATPSIMLADSSHPVIASSPISSTSKSLVGMSYTGGGNVTLNVNGVTVGTTSFPASGDNSIVALRGTSGNSIVADVFAFCTFTKALSEAEFLELYNSCTGAGAFSLLTGGETEPPPTTLKSIKIRLFYPDGTPASNVTLSWSLFQYRSGNTFIAGDSYITDADGYFEPISPGYAGLDVFEIGEFGWLTATTYYGNPTTAGFSQTPVPFVYSGPVEIIGVEP